MENKPKEKWYFKLSAILIAFLCVGPFSLPMVWFNPRFSLKTKIILSAVIIILSCLMTLIFWQSLKAINSYYQTIF